jgi:phage terminase Nu1 subunit (DNA packaging protein)
MAIATPTSPTDLLDLQAIAALFGVDLRTVRRWRRRPGNPLPTSRTGKRVYAIRGDVLEWVRSLSENPPARRLRKAP